MSLPMNDKSQLKNVPPWLQYMFVHGIKRALNALVKVIEDMQTENGWTPPTRKD